MVVPNIFVGGTGALAAEVNENFEFVTIHRKLFTDATTFNKTTSGFADAVSFTLSAPVGALITGIYFEAEVRNTGTGNFNVNLKLSGSNLGDLFIVAHTFTNGPTSGINDDNETRFHPGLSTSESELWQGKVSAAVFRVFSANLSPAIEVLDASTTVAIRFNNTTGTGSIDIKNIEVRITYVSGFTED